MQQRTFTVGGVAIFVAMTLLAGACASAPTPTVLDDVAQGGCSGNAYATSALAQNLGDAAPTCSDDVWTFTIPARVAPASPRRTEIVWGLHHGTLDTGEGADLVFDADITAHLGDAGRSNDDWHVFWQIVGMTRGQWKGPDFQIGVRAGRLRLWGGAGHPAHDWNGPNYAWDRPLTEFVDGRAYHVRVEAHLSTDPGLGRLSAWVDGKQVVDDWVPKSPTGRLPGTIVPEQSDVHVRSGLYRGTDKPHLPPTYEQDVTVRVRELS